MVKVKCAAIRTKAGQIFEGRSHADCYQVLKKAGVDLQTSRKCDQGFVTDEVPSRFVDRKVAAKLAFVSGQVSKLEAILFSEDLTGDWPWEKNK